MDFVQCDLSSKQGNFCVHISDIDIIMPIKATDSSNYDTSCTAGLSE